MLLAVFAMHATAQTYPTKPSRMVVPFAPGGTGEFLSRSITLRMGESMGQQFIVDFRGGAGTTLAAGLVAADEPAFDQFVFAFDIAELAQTSIKARQPPS